MGWHLVKAAPHSLALPALPVAPILALPQEAPETKGGPMALVDGGDLLVRAIKQEGVDTIFTLCAGHMRGVL